MKYYRDKDGDIWCVDSDKDPNKVVAYLYDRAFKKWVPGYPYDNYYQSFTLISEEEVFIEVL